MIFFNLSYFHEWIVANENIEFHARVKDIRIFYFSRIEEPISSLINIESKLNFKMQKS